MRTRQSRSSFFPAMMFFFLLPITLGCSPGKEMESPVPIRRSEESFGITGRPQQLGDHVIFNFEGYSIELNLKNLSCLLIDVKTRADTVISRAAFSSSAYRINDTLSEVSYPGLGIKAIIGFGNRSFTLELSSLKSRVITWPSVMMEKEGTSLIWPRFEGNYIPLHDTVWTDYLKSRKWNTTLDQYMPFWGVERGSQLLSYIIENPFHNTISFTEKKDALQMDFTHAFPDNADLSKPIVFRVYLDSDASPITPAKHFRQYLKDHDALVTLKDKMKTAPLISRLIGAPHAYIWDGAPITMADVKTNAWIPLAKAIASQATSKNPTAGRQIIGALSAEKMNFDAMSRQSAPPLYLKRGMANSLSKVLRSSRLYSDSVWPPATLPMPYRSTAERILDGENVPQPELVQLNSYLIHSSFPEYLNIPSTWGNGVSTRMIDELAQNGMDRFVLTYIDMEYVEFRPTIASYAAEKGYLIGPYDSYNGIQDPDAPEWSTAIFDRALFETGGIMDADGAPVKGFDGVGYYVSPIAIKPYFDARVAENFRQAPHSYYFMDCDAYGEFFDDYTPGRIVGASEDAAARVDRVRSIFEKYKIPVGSEGGSYLFAGSLAVAEGVFFPVMSGDPDMEINEMSRYFVGQPSPEDEPERFFLPVQLKDTYVKLFSDPRFRLPLYEAVFHDSVITTSHYASSSLKFANIAETGALTEILYQVAPMYHFNLSYFETIKAAIKNHIDVFEKTHSYSYRYPLDEFEYLTDDRNVQKTRFGDLELIANFQEKDFDFKGTNVPARSLLAAFTDSGKSFIYRYSDAQGISSLIKASSSTEWKERAQAALDLGRIGVPAKAGIPSLIRNLGDEEWQVRRAAATALANMGGEAESAVPALMKALKDEEWQLRMQAANALAALGNKAGAAVPMLIEALDDEEWQVVAAAGKALANMEEAALPAVPALMRALKDEEWQIRRPAAYALAAVGSRAKAAVPILIEALDDEEWAVRKAAALALGSIGADARAAIPALEERRSDSERQVRKAVEMAIKSINESRSPWRWLFWWL